MASSVTKEPTPGDTILSTYGVGVVIKILPSDPERNSDQNSSQFFKARLWRDPTKSIGSSAIAFLRFDSILKNLPAAPGCITTAKDDSTNDELPSNAKILIHCYTPWNDAYLVSTVAEGDSSDQRIKESSIIQSPSEGITEGCGHNITKLYELKSSDVEISKSGKFYPLIDHLIFRGNEAAASAKAMIQENPKLNKLMQGDNSENFISSDSFNSNIIQTASSFKEALPKAEEVTEIYKMLKDEELTVLLKKAETRLRQLSYDIPKATEESLRKMGVEVNQADAENGTTGIIDQTRKEALDALDNLLAENLDLDIETITTSLGGAFGNMFDTLSTAAQSDSSLSSILNDINEKTSEWQKETGRIFETKSSHLFFEGAQRLHQRVSNYFTEDQLQWAKNSASSFTKAFSEGDVAVAQLKSIELGESIRSRLIKAIEIRSDSEGGLDAIIAGAINKGADGLSDNGVQSLLSSFQTSVSSGAANTHESLISLLSDRSKYHEIAILQLEKVLLDLEDHLGEDLSEEEIASIARGEVGTAALFAPIARSAANEIEKQLDIAEESLTDPTFLSVLSHVRKIISGNLTMSSLVDEISVIFNDEEVVRKGESIVQSGEYLLDAIENASESRAVSDLVAVVEEAGFSKDSLLGQIENLNVNDLLETAEEAYSDEKKRHELLSSATDSALEFLLKILPSMPVPDFEGVKEGLIYSIKNLSMHGFKVCKEDIMVEIAGIRAAEQSETTEGELGTRNKVYSKFRNRGINGSGEEVEMSGTPLQVPDSTLKNMISRDVQATELLIIDVRNISAVFEKASWSFEQTYLPYLKSSGEANVKLSGGHIRLQFELRKKPTENNGAIVDGEWEPVLCLHKRTCSIQKVKLVFEGEGKMTWLINKLTAMLQRPLRDYVVSVLLESLLTQSGWLLENLNSILSSYWDIVLRTAGLTMDDLVQASGDDITTAWVDPLANEIDLVWTEYIPLGINLLTEKGCNLQVVDFPRGSQARKIAILKELDPDSFMGATILAVNGTRYDLDDRVELFAALKDPSRPKTIKFLLCEQQKLNKARKVATKSKKSQPEDHAQKSMKEATPFTVKSVNIVDNGPIGIKFAKAIDGCALVINGFSEEGCAKSFQLNETLKCGDLLIHVNGDPVVDGKGSWIEKSLESLERAGTRRPLHLGFVQPYLKVVMFDKSGDALVQCGGPEEFELEEKALPGGGNRIYFKGSQQVDGVVEKEGVFIGDHLIFINGNPVGSGNHSFRNPSSGIFDVHRMLQDKKSYPCALTFVRPNSVGVDASSTQRTFNVVACSESQLGFTVKENNYGNLVVSEFYGVSGYFQERISEALLSDTKEVAIESIDGQNVPTYATSDIVMNAMKRNWKKNGKLEILFCNDEQKRWLSSLREE